MNLQADNEAIIVSYRILIFQIMLFRSGQLLLRINYNWQTFIGAVTLERPIMSEADHFNPRAVKLLVVPADILQ